MVIAGGASHTNDYLESVKEKVKDNPNIIMTGFVQGPLMEELFSNCYLYCLPSDIEGRPISLLEAMSYGCNCLVSNIDENVQVIGEYAYSFEKSNVKDLQVQLEKMLDHKNRKDSTEISNYILKKYSWDDVVHKTEELYKKQ